MQVQYVYHCDCVLLLIKLRWPKNKSICDDDDNSDGHAGSGCDGDAGMACHQKLYLTKRSIFPGWIDPVLSTATVANNTAIAIWRSTKYATHSLLLANQ